MSPQVTTKLYETPSMAMLRAYRKEILDLADRRGVSKIRDFGSVACGHATPTSDVDLLVDFDTTHRGLDLFAFAREMEELLGHRVDVGTEVHPIIRRKVEAEAVPLGPSTTTRCTSPISTRRRHGSSGAQHVVAATPSRRTRISETPRSADSRRWQSQLNDSRPSSRHRTRRSPGMTSPVFATELSTATSASTSTSSGTLSNVTFPRWHAWLASSSP